MVSGGCYLVFCAGQQDLHPEDGRTYADPGQICIICLLMHLVTVRCSND